MAATFAELEAQVRGLDSRTRRNEEDIESIGGTVLEIRDDVKVLKRGVQALLAHQGIVIDLEVGEPDDA